MCIRDSAGTIYQATNWIYQGNSLRYNDSWSFKFSEDGEWQHGRTIFPYYGTNDPKKIQQQVDKPFWIRKEPRKHRYVYILAKGGERKKLLKTLKHPSQSYPKSDEVNELYESLKEVNHELWVIEDDIRDCERDKDFSETFIKLARSVYITNDKRASIKKDIDNAIKWSKKINKNSSCSPTFIISSILY